MGTELVKNDNAKVIFLEYSDFHTSNIEEGEVLNDLARFWSMRVFGERLSWEPLTLKLQELPSEPHIYVLVDEFQWAFSSPTLLSATQILFKSIASKSSVSYVAVGTFKLKDLMLPGKQEMGSPFNKADFIPMSPFNTTEMATLFELYKEHFDPNGISPDIQFEIMIESRGHPASFMLLLKLAMQHRPDKMNWASVLEKNIRGLLKGTHTALKKALNEMTTAQQARVRILIRNHLKPWRSTADDDFIRDLLNIGVLDSSGVPDSSQETDIQFTSGVILRHCIDTLFPKPTNRLSEEECKDAIIILGYGLQCISPSTVVDLQVRNTSGPQENAFQVALFAALNSLLPTTKKCLFEAKAEGRKRIDLMLTHNDLNLFGYELKVNAITESEFKPHLEQASDYAKYYRVPIYLVNFYLEGHSHPVQLTRIPDNVIVVNVQHSHDCKVFEYTSPDGKKITVKINDQS